MTKQTYSVSDIAKYIINTNFENGIRINYTRLNIYLYFVQLQNITSTKKPLFHDNIIIEGLLPYTEITRNKWSRYKFIPIPHITENRDTKNIFETQPQSYIEANDKKRLDDTITVLNSYRTSELKKIIKSHILIKSVQFARDKTITTDMMRRFREQLPPGKNV